MDNKHIGSLFPLHFAHSITTENFFSLWAISGKNSLLFHAARAALRYLIEYLNIKKLWLPGYICNEVLSACKNIKTDYFPIGEDLSPDLRFIEKNIRSGDALIAVDYFGLKPNNNFISYTRNRPDVIWIEDSVQSMESSNFSWGDYVIYSPRKLVGVPDGGIIISKKNNFVTSPRYIIRNSSDFISASLLRFEDEKEENKKIWYDAYKKSESIINAEYYPMSRISKMILTTLDPSPLLKARKVNYNILYDSLDHISIFGKATNFIPLGFLIKSRNRDEMAIFLGDNKVYAPRFWSQLPISEKEGFKFEKSLAQSILMLPCDHRYSENDMKRIMRLNIPDCS